MAEDYESGESTGGAVEVTDNGAYELYQEFCRYKNHRMKKWESVAGKATAFYWGEQWTEDVKFALEAQKRPPAVFNQCLPAVDLIVGHQIQNRVDFVASPVDQYADDEIADILTTGIKHIEEQNNATLERRFQFLDGIITGIGVVENWFDTETDMEGEIRCEQGSPWRYYLDPDFEKYDYRDGDKLFKESWLSAKQIKRVYGSAVWKKVRSQFMEGASVLQERRTSGEFADQPSNDYGNGEHFKGVDEYNDSELGGFGYSKKHNKYRVLERYEMRWEEVEFYLTADGELVREDELLDDEDREFSEPALTRNIKHIHLTTLIGHSVIAEDKALPNDEWYQLFNFYFPYFVNGRYMGVLENVFYPQEELNKAHSSMIHLLNTMTHAQLFYEDGAIDKEYEADIEDRLGTPSSIVKFTELFDRESGQPKFHIKQPVEPPHAYYQIIAAQGDNTKYITGATDAVQGISSRAESGRAKASDVQQASVRLTGIIENFRESQRLAGKGHLWWLQKFYTEQRWIRLRGDEQGNKPQEWVINQQIYGMIANDITVGKYDVVLSMEGKTKTERERMFFKYTELARVLGPEYGSVLARLALQLSDIPDKEEILAEISQIQQQQAQLAQMQQQVQGAGVGAPRGGIQSAPRPGRGIKRMPAQVQG